MPPAILIIDNGGQGVQRMLSDLLTAQGYEVLVAANQSEALALLVMRSIQAALIPLTSRSEVELIAAIRQQSPLPIIVVSSCDSETIHVAALDAGANVYVSKPFRPAELLARLRAAVRRAAICAKTVEIGPLSVQLDERRASVAGQEIELTPIEFDLLEVMARRVGTVVSHRRLLHELWGTTSPRATNSMRVLVCRLRRKLEPDPDSPRLLLTAPGIGYKLTDSNQYQV